MADHETTDLTIRMEITPGTDQTPIVTALIAAAESAHGVLAAWHEE